jgi:hypothetical protein
MPYTYMLYTGKVEGTDYTNWLANENPKHENVNNIDATRLVGMNES